MTAALFDPDDYPVVWADDMPVPDPDRPVEFDDDERDDR